MEKEKRINRIIKSINNYTDDVTNTRTMKVGVELDENLQNKLDILLEDADEKRKEILEELKKIFDNNPIDLIESAGQTINITKNNIKVDKIEDAVSPINGYSVYKSESIENDKNKTTYFCVRDEGVCYDEVNHKLYCESDGKEQDVRGIILKQDKNMESGDIEFVINKFSSQSLNNILSPSLRPNSKGGGDYSSKTLYKKLKGKITFKNDFNSGFFIESIYGQVSGEVCSFLDKYYTIQNDIQKTIKENLKNIDCLDKNIKIIELPTSVGNKEENDEYNKIVKQNNVLINLAKQKYESEAKSDKDDNYKEHFQLFKVLKGFPSFPLVENQHEINYNNLDELLKPYVNEAINWWNTINNKQMQVAMSHFHDRIVYKLFKYYYKIDDVVPNSQNHEYKLNYWKQEYINGKSPIEIILERIDKKINGINEYLEIQRSNEITDNQSQKQLTEWLRGKSLIVFEYLRQREDKNAFAKARGEFDLKSSMNTGIFAKDENKRSKIFEITGFSKAKKASILVENSGEYTETGYAIQKFSLAFNVSKSNGGFKVDMGEDINLEEDFENDDISLNTNIKNNLIKNGYINLPLYKKDENNNIVYKKDEDGNFKLNKKGQKQAEKIGDYVKIKKISFDKDGTFILPLKFGKRYAREYLYNVNTNFENLGETLNNARIIKEYSYKDKKFKYFVAITFAKLKGRKAPEKNDIEYKAIIGVDRGNILPVAITITDLDGKVIDRPEIKICKDFAEKHKEIEKLKREQSSKVGQYEANLRKKAKNFSKATIEKIGAELLYYATKYNALIVLEDLNREFGIKQMMATNQYTKLEDYLTRKLKENGLMLMKKDIAVNKRSGLLGKVVAQYTSKTCSQCGFVASSEKLKNVPLELKNIDGKDVWFAILDGKEISLDMEYETYIKAKGHNERFNANDEITRLKQKDTKKNKELIEKILLNVLNPRKTQAEYICPICGHRENADQQASLNIARRWLFIESKEYKKYKKLKNTKNSIPYWKAVEDFSESPERKWNQSN